MRYLTAILFGLITTAVTAQAGGAADLVAKKSNSGGFTYSNTTQYRFLHDCSENANNQVCKCVLNKLQKKYSEKEYRKFDADLQKGIENKKFTSFISKAVTECDAIVDETGPMVSEERAEAYVDSLLQLLSKKEYMADCIPRMKEVLGSNAKKTCSCAFDQFVSHPSELVQEIMTNGFETDNVLWTADFVFDCMPQKMTPDIKNHFIEQMNLMGIPKSIAQCTIDAISKEYSFGTLLKIAIKEPDTINQIFKIMGTRCSLEQY